MASLTTFHSHQNDLQIPGGPSPRNKLGASKSEVLAVAFGALVLVLITLSFWFSATR